MNSRAPLLIVGLALIAAMVAWIMTDGEPDTPDHGEGASGAPASPERRRSANEIRKPSKPPPERREVRGSETPDPTPAARAAEGSQITGLVKDIRGTPVGGVKIAFETRGYFGTRRVRSATLDEFTVEAGGDGVFAMKRPGAHGYFVASSSEYATLLDYEWTTTNRKPEIIVGPRRDYSGIVVDNTGTGVSGVALVVRAEPALILSLRPGVQQSAPIHWTEKTDERGHFAFSVPWSPGTTLSLAVRGFEPIRRSLPDHADTSLQLRLLRTGLDSKAIVGQVVWESGKPVDGAMVYLDKRTVRTDATGRFAFEGEKARNGGELFAVAKGWSSAPRKLATGDPTDPIVLTVARRPMAIRGRVVDGRGEPMSNSVVFVRGGPGLGFAGLKSPVDAKGGFALSPLLPGKYEVFAFDTKTLEAVRESEIEAGTVDLEIEMPGTATRRRVSGRVQTLAGEPLPGVRLFVGRSTRIGKSRFFAPLVTQDVPKTDAEGRFAFEPMCIEGTYLMPSGIGVAVSDRVQLDARTDLTRLEIRLSVTCRFQVLMRDPNEADAVKVLDTKGSALHLEVRIANSARVGRTAPLRKGHSEVIQVAEHGTILVLLKGGKEVRRVAITLDPKNVKLIRL